ncbi:hypothetical protein AB4Y42_34705 [Paraburkholderia sp. EG286B]|uniref:hypothetical protein n=1 Tax=Paraburkholderia sp. EG286B TaxID=3237011 RepID=UPI0034D31990
MNDMREHLMQTLAALRDKENPMDIDRAKAVAHVASVLVDTAKVEVEYIKATDAIGGSAFMDNQKRLPGDSPSAVERTPTGLVHRAK